MIQYKQALDGNLGREQQDSCVEDLAFNREWVICMDSAKHVKGKEVPVLLMRAAPYLFMGIYIA